MSAVGIEGNEPPSRAQDAVRILLIISAAAESLREPPLHDPALADAVAVVQSQVRLQKLDFWVRNPDYLADELLTEYEHGAGDYRLRQAEAILASDEPQVRRYPMIRYLFGAYEPLDDAVAVLRSAGLVIRRKRGSAGRVRQHDYYLTRAGRDTADRITTDFPVFRYFVERTRLAAGLAEGRPGTHLKDRQYRQEEYRDTRIGKEIRSIAPRVRDRLQRHLSGPSSQEVPAK
ncbi:hypothetical protein [Actinoplanes sp. NPDC051411]|uniref:hypothetical protein n=1 Tax=Actinoplanes sp. NPDC051411 TaxID=3155522 RepID=UPI003447FB28